MASGRASTTPFVGLAIALAALLFASFLIRSGRHAVDGAETPKQTSHEKHESEDVRATDIETTAESSAPSEPPTRENSTSLSPRCHGLVGRVLDTDGAPIGGARIEARRVTWADPTDLDSARTAAPLPSHAISAADGSFRVDDAPLSADIELSIAADGFAQATLEPVRGVSDLDVFVGTATLLHEAVVRGRVVDSHGGVAGASVYVPHSDATTKSGADGEFELRGIAEGEISILASKDGFIGRLAPGLLFSLKEGEVRENLEVTLEKARVVEGLAVDDKDEPVAGVAIECSVESSARSAAFEASESVICGTATSGSDGKFEIACPDSGPFWLHAHALGFLEDSHEFDEVKDELTLRLLRLREIRVHVTDAATKERVEPVRVRCVVNGTAQSHTSTISLFERESPSCDFRCDPIRLFMIVPAMPDGAYLDVTAIAPGYVPRTVEAIPIPEGEGPIEADVALPRGGTLLGNVRDASTSQPLVAAEVELFADSFANDSNDPQDAVKRAIAITDADGRFRVTGLVTDRWRVEAHAGGHVATTLHDVLIESAGEPAHCEIALPPASRIRGKVIGASDKAMDGLFVVAVNESAESQFARVDPLGAFYLDRLSAGTWEIGLLSEHGGERVGSLAGAIAPSRMASPLVVRLEAGAEQSIDIPIAASPFGSIEGTLRMKGVPARGFTIECVGRYIGSPQPITCRTGQNGQFKTSLLDARDWALLVHPSGSNEIVACRFVSVAPGSTRLFDIDVSCRRFVATFVDAETGLALTDGTVTIDRFEMPSPSDNDFAQRMLRVRRIGAQGRCEFDDVVPGEWDVRFEPSEGNTYVGVERGIVMSKDRDLELTIPVAPAGSLLLTIDADGFDDAPLPMEGLSLTLEGGANTIESRIAERIENGGYRAMGLKPGNYVVRTGIEVLGKYLELEAEAVVTAHQETEVALRAVEKH